MLVKYFMNMNNVKKIQINFDSSETVILNWYFKLQELFKPISIVWLHSICFYMLNAHVINDSSAFLMRTTNAIWNNDHEMAALDKPKHCSYFLRLPIHLHFCNHACSSRKRRDSIDSFTNTLKMEIKSTKQIFHTNTNAFRCLMCDCISTNKQYLGINNNGSHSSLKCHFNNI